jgi:septal ring factor EnvC (AmiA/AmiB activator)
MKAKEELEKNLSGWNKRLGELAYQKIQIERDIATLEAAIQAGKAVLANMNTEEAITEAISQTQKKEEEINND